MRAILLFLLMVAGLLFPRTAGAQTCYRGGRYMDPTPKDYKIRDGLVQPERGVSLSTNKEKMQRFGGAYRVVSYPPTLKIVQQGRDPEHYEMPPAKPMKLDDYVATLAQVKLEREDW